MFSISQLYFFLILIYLIPDLSKSPDIFNLVPRGISGSSSWYNIISNLNSPFVIVPRYSFLFSCANWKQFNKYPSVSTTISRGYKYFLINYWYSHQNEKFTYFPRWSRDISKLHGFCLFNLTFPVSRNRWISLEVYLKFHISVVIIWLCYCDHFQHYNLDKNHIILHIRRMRESVISMVGFNFTLYIAIEASNFGISSFQIKHWMRQPSPLFTINFRILIGFCVVRFNVFIIGSILSMNPLNVL